MSRAAYLAARVEAALNRCLALDPELGEELAALEGSVVEVHMEGFDRSLRLWPRLAGVAVEVFAGDAPEPLPRAHVRISGPPITLAAMAAGLAGGGAGNEVPPVGVEVSGDMRLAQRLGELVRRADLDWEEPVARLLGDGVAHELGRGVRGLLAWTRGAAETLLLDAGEYLREERHAAADAGQVEDLARGVERLRDDVERLEKRIERLAAASPREEPQPPRSRDS